jgi:modulator of FtsH protease HflC
MGSTIRFILLMLLAVGGFIAYNAAFIVPQTYNALVFQFGKVARPVITAPGLYFKVPFVENVALIDKRVLSNDLQPQTVLALDRKNLVVDAFMRYQVSDPLKFYQSLPTPAAAASTLERIVNDSVRSVLAGARTSEIINTKRTKLMEDIQESVNKQTQALGITVVDVRLSRVDLPEKISESVFQRMNTDRQREAADLRAKGAQFAQKIRAEADRDVQVILGEANRKAQEERGVGDAEKTKIMAEAFSRDAEFSAFFRSMQAYEQSFRQGDTRMILSPDSPFFRYFNNPGAAVQTPKQ